MSKYYTRMDHDLYRTNGFNRFMLTKESAILYFLVRYVVRETDHINLKHVETIKHFDEFIGNKKLVAWYSQVKMSEIFGLPQSSISRYITKLETYGFLKKINKPILNTKAVKVYYEVGTFELNDKGKKTNEELYVEKLYKKHYEELQNKD